MITGAHSIIYSTDPGADRAFIRDVFDFPHVDVGGGWLIFGLPPAEVAVHPSENNDVHEFYLMCNDIKALIDHEAANAILSGSRRREQQHTDQRNSGDTCVQQFVPMHELSVPSWEFGRGIRLLTAGQRLSCNSGKPNRPSVPDETRLSIGGICDGGLWMGRPIGRVAGGREFIRPGV